MNTGSIIGVCCQDIDDAETENSTMYEGEEEQKALDVSQS
jgi:hypothetical protein